MENEKKKRSTFIAAALSKAVTLLGGASVGAALIMSEALYPEIEELSNCPPWYKAFFYVSLAASVVGVILCAAFQRTHDGAQIARLKRERTVELIAFCLGFVLMVGAALSSTENRFLDFAICVGGALCSVGLFSLLGTAIALAFSKPNGFYASLINETAAAGNSLVALRDPAPLGELLAFETALGAMLPRELIAFYRETNGDGDLMFSVEEAWETTELLRKYDTGDGLVCIGGDGAGNYFGYRATDEGVADGIFRYDHEEMSLTRVADTLAELIANYYADKL